jgi:hypothetical protein
MYRHVAAGPSYKVVVPHKDDNIQQRGFVFLEEEDIVVRRPFVDVIVDNHVRMEATDVSKMRSCRETSSTILHCGDLIAVECNFRFGFLTTTIEHSFANREPAS